MIPLEGMKCLLRQREKGLVRFGLPRMLGLSDAEFRAKIASLASRLEPEHGYKMSGNVPLCIAYRRSAVDPREVMSRIKVRGSKGVVDMTPLKPDAFSVLDTVAMPAGDLYLLIDVDTGRNFLNVTPADALADMAETGRTPLSLDEGVALTAQYPELLTDKSNYNCIQMPGSRTGCDQRVPSIWFSRGQPRLGWCWDRNVHTWLGSASARCRLG